MMRRFASPFASLYECVDRYGLVLDKGQAVRIQYCFGRAFSLAVHYQQVYARIAEEAKS